MSKEKVFRSLFLIILIISFNSIYAQFYTPRDFIENAKVYSASSQTNWSEPVVNYIPVEWAGWTNPSWQGSFWYEWTPINGDWRFSIAAHPDYSVEPSLATVAEWEVQNPKYIQTLYGLSDNQTYGNVRFVIQVITNNSTINILDEVIADHDYWRTFYYDLSQWKDETIKIKFIADPNGVPWEDWARWGEPTIECFEFSNTQNNMFVKNTGLNDQFMLVESPLYKIYLDSKGGSIVRWYLKEKENNYAGVDFYGSAYAAQRFAIYDPISWPNNWGEKNWPEGWPSRIGHETYSTEVLSLNKEKAVVKQSLLVSPGSIFSGMKVDKIYTFWRNKYHIDVKYQIKNTTDEIKCYVDESGGLHGFVLTVESVFKTIHDLNIAFKSNGKICINDTGPQGPDYLLRQTDWIVLEDPIDGIVAGSKYSSGRTYTTWIGEPKANGIDYEILFKPVVYYPGQEESYNITFYLGPGSVDIFQKIMMQKSTDEQLSENIPFEYSLEQNFPNPFNPTTRISFQLPANEFVTLKVYDVLGKEIQTLINEQKSSGEHYIEFDGSNLPSGIYFYKMQAGNFVQTKKFVLMK